MNRISATFAIQWLVLVSSLSFVEVVRSQNSVTVNPPPNAVTILDSTKQQDGLNGSVRRVKTESSKLETKAGRIIEGPRKLVEVTTYDVSGKRIENFTYPVANSPVGKEEYEYDATGNIVAMTMRDDGGTILSKETYTYEFDRFGNWTKMVTKLVVFEGGELKQEPIEVTYRNLTYYFDDSVAKMVDSPPPSKSLALPTTDPPTMNFKAAERPPLSHVPLSRAVPVGDPPPELKTAAQAPKTVSPNRSIGSNDASLNSANRLGTQSNLPKVSPGSTEKLNPTRPASPQGEAVSSTRSASANLASRERTVESAPLKKTVGTTSLEIYDAGRELFSVGDFKGAVEAFLRSIELEPNSAEVYLNLGHAYLKLSKDKDAAKAFKECMRLNPEIVDGIYGFGLASYRMRHFQDAAKAFKRATALRPALAKAHYGLALAYQELGEEKGVVEEYRILQTLDAGLAKQLAKALSDLSLPCKVPPYCK